VIGQRIPSVAARGSEHHLTRFWNAFLIMDVAAGDLHEWASAFPRALHRQAHLSSSRD